MRDLLKFQSTHPRGVRLMLYQYYFSNEYFNPRTHVGCDPGLSTDLAAAVEFQSTHPRGVRRMCILRVTKSWYISIHAPTWGATDTSNTFALKFTVFQSTHPRGVRPGCTPLPHRPYYFNPRTHVGCDTDKLSDFTRVAHFNPRTHVGCDTHGLESKSPKPYFNPRTHVGCDRYTPLRCTNFAISIHAPTWGATK